MGVTGPPPGRWLRLARRAPLVGSGVLGIALAIVHTWRPDPLAALTVAPPWAWLVPGLALTIFDLRSRRGWLVVGGWLIFGLAFAGEPRGLARGLARRGTLAPGAGRPPEGSIRVVSLNCAIGNPRAADEVAAYGPDIVLLQESPGRAEVERLARAWFGAEAGVVAGPDAALVVRGRAEAADLPAAIRGYFVQARVVLARGPEVEVVSTRLVPAVFRLDLWSPDCWREQAANRRQRRRQARAIADRVRACPVPVIVGGDMNAPPGDGALREFGPGLADAFDAAGLGWGDTIIDEAPFLRIDQVWAGPALRPLAVTAHRTIHSDHRLVVCDLAAPPRP